DSSSPPRRRRPASAASILGPSVRYLRMLSNCVVAGCLATAYVLALSLRLNPTLPLQPARLVPLVASVGLFYAVNLTVGFYMVLVLREFLGGGRFLPAWVRVEVL